MLVGATRQGDRVEVGQLLAALEQHYHQGVDLPRAISTLAFEDLALFYSQADSRLTLACTLTLRVAGADVRLDLNTVVQGGTAGHSVSITGALTVAGHAFNFSGASSTEGAEKSGKPKQQLALVATYVHRPDENTPAPDIHELVLALAPAAAEVVPHIKLTDALIAYLSEGDADHSTARWLLGACFDAELDLHAALNGVPIVSALLGDRLNLSVSALQLLVASKPFSESDIDALGQPAGFSFPATLGHALITGQLGVGSDHHPLTLNMGEQPAVPAPPPSADAADAADAADEASGTAPMRTGDTLDAAATANTVVAPAPPTSPSPGATDTQWIAIAQHFGPLYLEQVGVAYRNSRVSIALGLSITAAEMSLSLQGLRIETPLNAFKPSFDLAGLGLTYSASTLEVSGGLLKTGTGVATRYDGEALIKASGFTIAALGSYASTPQGDASLFIYGLLNKELGGPTLFHVTGLAAGFGYNRRLTLPTLDTVGSFPLVSMAKADTAGTAGAAAAPPDLTAVLAQLGSVLEVASGEHWLALGVRFTSYEVIDTFALLVVSFGTQVEIDLIGESTLSMPAKLDAGQQPIAYARLAERATFIPDRGIFTAAAKLSDDAYILSRDCHLSGGFAVSSWFKDALAGDFVVTLGGYHPSYAKPAHYPDVVPVGFTWQLGDLDIKGGLYFALTPTTVMASGHLDAVWQSGALRAWFLVHADFLMSWKPFHYEAEVGVGIGASFRVDLWITSFTMTVRVDVELQLWGPSFGGTARVDLSVISFSVDFGAPRPAKAWISWSAFKQSFLPPWVDVTTATPTRAPALTAAPLMPPSYATELDDDGLIRPPPKLGSAYCMARAAAGLDRDLGAVWVVNGSEFELVTHSLIPAQSARMFFHGDIASVSLLPGADPKARPNVEVGPMNLQDAEFISEHFVVFSRLDDQTQLPVPTPDFLRHVNVEPRWAKVPPAIWAVGASSTDTQLKTALIGFRFWAKLVSTRSKSVDVKTLEVQDQEPMPARFWSAPERLELPEAAGLMADYGQVLADHADHADNADSAPGEPALRDAVCSLMVSTLRAHQDLRTALLDELGQHLVLQADERTQTLPLDMGLVMRCEPRFAPLGELI